jgi:uncharacterized paraquat-inducible protein A
MSFLGIMHTARAFQINWQPRSIFGILSLESAVGPWSMDPDGQSLAAATIPDYTKSVAKTYRCFVVLDLRQALMDDVFLRSNMEQN